MIVIAISMHPWLLLTAQEVFYAAIRHGPVASEAAVLQRASIDVEVGMSHGMHQSDPALKNAPRVRMNHVYEICVSDV